MRRVRVQGMTWNYHHEVHHAKPTPPPKFIPQAVKSFVRVIKDRNGLDELRTTFDEASDAIDTNHDGKLDCEGARGAALQTALP